jgi:hypothetical protein
VIVSAEWRSSSRCEALVAPLGKFFRARAALRSHDAHASKPISKTPRIQG